MVSFLITLILLYFIIVIFKSWKEILALFFLRRFTKKNTQKKDKTIKEEPTKAQTKAQEDFLNGGDAEYVDFEEINEK